MTTVNLYMYVNLINCKVTSKIKRDDLVVVAKNWKNESTPKKFHVTRHSRRGGGNCKSRLLHHGHCRLLSTERRSELFVPERC
jgi:hypothetical protein